MSIRQGLGDKAFNMKPLYYQFRKKGWKKEYNPQLFMHSKDMSAKSPYKNLNTIIPFEHSQK